MIARSTGDERWSERYTEYINLCESKLEMTRLNWLPYTSAKLQRTCSHELREYKYQETSVESVYSERLI